ncbi:MAG: threonine synthase, partial [Lachnospiraceae bacterium]|nr:threonine synthase [Lachnospiraceae bacterium]
YVIDTHTAVAATADNNIKQDNKSVVVSTASPYKFTRHVLRALGVTDADDENIDDFLLVDELCKLSKVKIPAAIEEIKNADIIHNNNINVDEMEKFVRNELLK